MSTMYQLQINEQVLQTAEAYANQTGRELEDLIQAYLRELAARQDPSIKRATQSSSVTDALMGKYCG